MTDQPKLDPSPRPGVMHNFDCTHDPCRCRPQRLSDLIIEHGPYYAAQLNPITAPTTAELNELREELIAARKAPDLGRFRTYVVPHARALEPQLGITHDECPSRWFVEEDDFATLAELNLRAAEHAEVCG